VKDLDVIAFSRSLMPGL